MPTRVRPMTPEETDAYISVSLAAYIEERIAAGESAEEARSTADSQHGELFPGGVPAPGQHLLRVLDDDGSAVGTLWIGPRRPESPEAFWVWDVVIDEDRRGRGLGRAAMALAETEARTHGATEIGLNVWGHNAVARHLYESIGYETTAVNMRKVL